MEEVELHPFRVVVEFEVDAEDAERAQGEVAGICETATEDTDDPPVTFSRVLQVIRVGPKTRRPKRNTLPDAAAQAAIAAAYRRKAQELYTWYSDDLVIDEDAAVSDCETGAFVSAWLWVRRAELQAEIELAAEDRGDRRQDGVGRDESA